MQQWLSTLPYGVLNQWEAFDAVEPIGEHWRQTAQLSSDIRGLIGMEMAKLGSKLEFPTINDCMPPRYSRPKRPKPPEKKVSLASMCRSIVSAFGFRG